MHKGGRHFRKGRWIVRSEIVSQEKTTVVLHVEVEQERFDAAVRDAVREMSKQVDLKGFRKGHAPRRVLEMYFGRKALYNEALESLMPTVVEELTEEYDLVPLENPVFNFATVEEGQPLVVDITFEVRPEVILPALTEIAVDKPLLEVSEQDIDTAVEEFRRARATLVSVEGRPSEGSDTVLVSYTATVEGEETPVETNSSPIALAAPELRREIREALLGRVKGDEADVTVAMEADANPRYAGKAVQYHFVVTDVQQEILPELNDDTVGTMTSGGAKTVEDLRNRMRRRMETEMTGRVNLMVRNGAFAQLAERATVADLPEKVVLRRMTQLREDDLEEARRQGKEGMDALLQSLGKDQETYDRELRERGELHTRNGLVVDVLAEQFQMQVSQEDLEMEFRRIALHTGSPLKKIYEQYGRHDHLLNELVSAIRTKKTLDHLATQVTVREMSAEEYRAKHAAGQEEDA